MGTTGSPPHSEFDDQASLSLLGGVPAYLDHDEADLNARVETLGARLIRSFSRLIGSMGKTLGAASPQSDTLDRIAPRTTRTSPIFSVVVTFSSRKPREIA